MKPVWLMAICLLTTSFAMANPEEEKAFKIHPLDSADLVSTEAAVQTLVGDEGNVILDAKHHRLLVYTTPTVHARVEKLLADLSLPPRNVRIEVSFAEAGTTRESGAAIHGRGDVVIHHDEVEGSLVLQPTLKNQVTETSNRTTQSLLVASGREGHIMVGEQIPHLNWLVEYGRRWGYVEGQIDWQEVGARLVVEPTVLADGKTIRVRLTPELSGAVDGQPHHTRFARAATEVVVTDGQPFRLGGLDKESEFYSRFLIGFDRSGSQQTLDITLTPRILTPSAQPAP